MKTKENVIDRVDAAEMAQAAQPLAAVAPDAAQSDATQAGAEHTRVGGSASDTYAERDTQYLDEHKPNKRKKRGQYKLRYSLCLKAIAFVMVLLGIYVASITSIYLFARSNGGFFTLGGKAVQTLVESSYGTGYLILLNLIASVVVFLLALWYLYCAAGHTPRSTQIVMKGWAKLPLDVLTILAAAACGTLLGLGMQVLNPVGMVVWDWQIFWFSITLFAVAIAALLLYLLNIAVRCKVGDIWRNTVVYRLCAFVVRLLAKAARWFGAGCGCFFGQLPFIWKGLVIPFGMVVLNLLWLWVCVEGFEVGAYIAVTVLQVLVLAVGYLYSLLALNHLAEGGRAVAEGNLDYQIDTGKLCFELKEHAENINRMGGCLTQAVNEQLKSERMKTELITNVSHDIKTPLTSIINYADLLSKEPTDNEKIVEYTGVIARQSERLKRLIEDLVEASKASTGNLEVTPAPCEIGVLLSQAVGEYQQRLTEQDLTLVAKQPEQPLCIMADGRHLWRVFDNLLGNIYKYAQSGTRVYLSLEQQGAQAVITFKNISKYPLDISAEELMERFVRGDASRHNEGNGLGLSIAQSLTELQGGHLSLHVDGDLFKVALAFDLVEAPKEG